MPLYEYRCPDGHDFEKFYRSIGTASTEVECPICGKISNRVMSTAGLVFKGSGFYITDYGKDGKKAEREAATAEKTKSDAAATAKSTEGASTEGGAGATQTAAAEKSPAPAGTSPPSSPAPASPASSGSSGAQKTPAAAPPQRKKKSE